MCFNHLKHFVICYSVMSLALHSYYDSEPVYKTFRRYRLIYVGLAFSEENVNILLGECH